MLIGSYSITHLRAMYNDPQQRHHLEKHRNLFIFGAIIWLLALVLLIIYWKYLETWARVIGIIGLLFNYGGSLFTLFVIFFGMKDSNLPDPVPEVTVQPTNESAELINMNPPIERMASPTFTTVPVDRSSSANSTTSRSYSAESSTSVPSNELINMNPPLDRMTSPTFATVPVYSTTSRSYSTESSASVPSTIDMGNRAPSSDVSTVPEINF